MSSGVHPDRHQVRACCTGGWSVAIKTHHRLHRGEFKVRCYRIYPSSHIVKTQITLLHLGTFLKCVFLSHIMPIQGNLPNPFYPLKSFMLCRGRDKPASRLNSKKNSERVFKCLVTGKFPYSPNYPPKM